MVELSLQAKFVLLVCIIQIVFFQLSTVFLPISTNDKLVIFFLVLVALSISTFYVTYSVNCMVVGKCNMWAWIIAGIFIASSVFGMLGTTTSLTTGGIIAPPAPAPGFDIPKRERP
jgi:hypothetical protein